MKIQLELNSVSPTAVDVRIDDSYLGRVDIQDAAIILQQQAQSTSVVLSKPIQLSETTWMVVCPDSIRVAHFFPATSLELTITASRRCVIIPDRWWVLDLKKDKTRHIEATRLWMVCGPEQTVGVWPFGNVYGSGLVCWGTINPPPSSLPREIDALFFGSGFNRDLVYTPWPADSDCEKFARERCQGTAFQDALVNLCGVPQIRESVRHEQPAAEVVITNITTETPRVELDFNTGTVYRATGPINR